MVDLLGALNTGHEGGCATVHANAATDVPARLEALGLLAGIGRDAMHAQVHAALDVVVHLVRRADGRRQVAELGVLERTTGGRVEVLPAVIFGTDGGLRPGPGEPLLRRRIELA